MRINTKGREKKEKQGRRIRKGKGSRQRVWGPPAPSREIYELKERKNGERVPNPTSTDHLVISSDPLESILALSIQERRRRKKIYWKVKCSAWKMFGWVKKEWVVGTCWFLFMSKETLKKRTTWEAKRDSRNNCHSLSSKTIFSLKLSNNLFPCFLFTFFSYYIAHLEHNLLSCILPILTDFFCIFVFLFLSFILLGFFFFF